MFCKETFVITFFIYLIIFILILYNFTIFFSNYKVENKKYRNICPTKHRKQINEFKFKFSNIKLDYLKYVYLWFAYWFKCMYKKKHFQLS